MQYKEVAILLIFIIYDIYYKLYGSMFSSYAGGLGLIMPSVHAYNYQQIPYNTSMKGFDTRFRDLQDYIIVITDEIWEQRG